jgi:hypothetical protein
MSHPFIAYPLLLTCSTLLAVRDKITLTQVDENLKVTDFMFCNFSDALLLNVPQAQLYSGRRSLVS